MWNIEISLYERRDRCIQKIKTFFMKEAAATAASIPNDILFMREAAATWENIHTCFEKEAAAASTKIHIPFLRDMAAALEKIHTLFTKEVATAYQMTLSL
jgi:hypothetical protein